MIIKEVYVKIVDVLSFITKPVYDAHIKSNRSIDDLLITPQPHLSTLDVSDMRMFVRSICNYLSHDHLAIAPYVSSADNNIKHSFNVVLIDEKPVVVMNDSFLSFSTSPERNKRKELLLLIYQRLVSLIGIHEFNECYLGNLLTYINEA